jgi:hypothetical protein
MIESPNYRGCHFECWFNPPGANPAGFFIPANAVRKVRMSEPTTSAFVATGAIAVILGPVFGPFALLLFAAAAGAMLAMSKAPSMTRMEGFRFIVVGVAIALTLTGFAVWLVERYTPIPGNLALMPLAFALSAGRDTLLKLIERGGDALGKFFDALATRSGNEHDKGSRDE